MATKWHLFLSLTLPLSRVIIGCSLKFSTIEFLYFELVLFFVSCFILIFFFVIHFYFNFLIIFWLQGYVDARLAMQPHYVSIWWFIFLFPLQWINYTPNVFHFGVSILIFHYNVSISPKLCVNVSSCVWLRFSNNNIFKI